MAPTHKYPQLLWDVHETKAASERNASDWILVRDTTGVGADTRYVQRMLKGIMQMSRRGVWSLWQRGERRLGGDFARGGE